MKSRGGPRRNGSNARLYGLFYLYEVNDAFRVWPDIKAIQAAARAPGAPTPPPRPRWPMIVLRTPKGWTGPAVVDGKASRVVGLADIPRNRFIFSLFDAGQIWIADLADPRKPEVAGRWWLPGMNQAKGEKPNWPEGKRYALHHAIIAGDTAYGSWRDGGLTLLDVKDRTRPKLISHRNWSPPFGGGTHTALPLPDRDLLVVLDEAVLDNQEDGEKLIWLFDIREPSNPVSISTFPQPDETDYVAKGAHFGPHNLHENRPGSFISSTLIFATWQNAGVRAYDISNPYRPVETGALVPAAPERMMDTRPNRPQVIQSCDVFVDAQGIIYSTDYNGGLSVIEYLG